MRKSQRALVRVTFTIELAHSIWVLMAILAIVSVGSASVLSQVAAVVTLPLNVSEAVLLAHELLTDSHVM